MGRTQSIVRGGVRILFATLFIALSAGCASRQAVEFTATPDQLASPDSTWAAADADIRIAPLDVLEIRVFGAPELDGEYQVDLRGFIDAPLLGEVVAQGYTNFEFADILEGKFGERYLQNPDVAVTLTREHGPQVTMEGAVTRPGLYPVTGEISLLQAVAMSGGLTDDANPRRVVVFRTIDGQRQAAAFNLVDIRNGRAGDPAVYGNDVIVVDGANVRRTYRDIIMSVPLAALFLAI